MKPHMIMDTADFDLDKYIGMDIDMLIDTLKDISSDLKSKYNSVTLDVGSICDGEYVFVCTRLETTIEMAERKAKLEKSKVRHDREEEKKKDARFRAYHKLKKEFGDPE